MCVCVCEHTQIYVEYCLSKARFYVHHGTLSNVEKNVSLKYLLDFYVSDKPGGNILRAKDSKVVLCCTVLQNAVLYPPLTRNIHRNTH